MEDYVRLSKETLEALIAKKLEKTGLMPEHARTVADHLAYADSRGVHSHGAVRVEYYAERIAKGGSTIHPDMTFEQTGPCSGLCDGDNAVGFVVAKYGMEKAIELAKKNRIGIVGMRRMGHCGTLSYYLRMAAQEGMLALSMCQSDPMVSLWRNERLLWYKPHRICSACSQRIAYGVRYGDDRGRMGENSGRTLQTQADTGYLGRGPGGKAYDRPVPD